MGEDIREEVNWVHSSWTILMSTGRDRRRGMVSTWTGEPVGKQWHKRYWCTWDWKQFGMAGVWGGCENVRR